MDGKQIRKILQLFYGLQKNRVIDLC